MCSEDSDLGERQANDRSDHFCIATFNLNNTTRELIPSFKRCFLGGAHSDCGIGQCLAYPVYFDPMLYTCCCNTTLCNVDAEMLPPLTVLPGQSII